jgi:hypothetical protein
MPMHRPTLKPINISNGRNARNKASLSSSTLRNTLYSQTIRQSESGRIRLGQNIDSSGRSHSGQGLYRQ